MTSKIILLTTVILLTSTLCVRVVMQVIKFRSRSKKLEIWSQFMANLVLWADEITDPFIRGEFMNYSLNIIMESHNVDTAIRKIEEIPDIMKEIEIKYAKYIPSLVEEFRDQKLKKLLK